MPLVSGILGRSALGFFELGAGPDALQLISALAIAENVVQLQFDMPIYFSGLGDPADGSIT
jgi:hypothetical protein